MKLSSAVKMHAIVQSFGRKASKFATAFSKSDLLLLLGNVWLTRIWWTSTPRLNTVWAMMMFRLRTSGGPPPLNIIWATMIGVLCSTGVSLLVFSVFPLCCCLVVSAGATDCLKRACLHNDLRIWRICKYESSILDQVSCLCSHWCKTVL